jgi:hypothetical protein
MDDKDKHKVPIELHTLHDTPINPPRRKLWDFVPEWLGMWLIKRGYNPKPTPRELWHINSIMLRAYYKRFYSVVELMNYQASVEGISAFLPDVKPSNSPGSTELN